MGRKIVVSPESSAEVKWAFIVSLIKPLDNFSHLYRCGAGINIHATVGPAIDESFEPISAPTFSNVKLRLKWDNPTLLMRTTGRTTTTERLSELSSDYLELVAPRLGIDAVLNTRQSEYSYRLDLQAIIQGLFYGEGYNKAMGKVSPDSDPLAKLGFIYSCLRCFAPDGRACLPTISGLIIRLKWPGGGIYHWIGRRISSNSMKQYLSDIVMGEVDDFYFYKPFHNPLDAKRLLVVTGSSTGKTLILNIAMRHIVSGLIKMD